MSTIRNILMGRPAERYQHEPGTVEVEDEDGNISIRRATGDEIEYARRVIEHIESDLDGPPPARPWSEAERSAGWGDEHGVESGHVEPQGPPPLPDPYPLSGSACYRCPPRGTDDPRCCQHKNFAYINRLREARYEHDHNA